MITVYLTAALICWGPVEATTCAPAIVGRTTPVGKFALRERIALDERYGGRVLQFDEAEYTWTGIHQTWPGREHLYDLPANHRRHVSDGCVNVQPHIMRQLLTLGPQLLEIKR